MGMSKANDNPSTWNWWRNHHGYAFFPALHRTFNFLVIFKIKNFYAGICLKWFAFKFKHMPWTKYPKLSRRVKELEIELFGDDDA